MRAVPAIAAISALCACGGGGGAATPSPSKPGGDSPPAATRAEPTCDPAPDPPAHGGPLRWYHDDYASAKACAAKLGRPLVIDLWAPWCHTCISMKTTVLTSPALEPLADRFVFLAVDTDRPENAAVVDRFPPAAWPTFFVVDPGDASIEARFVGAASLRQFRELLVTGERAYLDDRAGELAADSPLRLMRDAHRAEAADNYELAGQLYDRALAAAPADWSRRPDVLVSRIGVFYRRDELADCAAFAGAHLDETGRSASAADFAYYAGACIGEMDDPTSARPVLDELIARVRGLVDDADAPLSVDDRSDALRILRELHLLAGQPDQARAAAREQKALLDKAIASAPTPFAAMTYNWPAAEVYSYLGIPGELVGVLERSVAALPDQYDPPYRLAWVLLQAQRPDEALVQARKALDLVYGPRKARVQGLIADIHRARGDRPAELAALRKVVEIYEQLPDGQKNPAALERAKKALNEAEARD
jgi:thioredoxin-like negative regulator of GroEL